jgi:hypothetical protein
MRPVHDPKFDRALKDRALKDRALKYSGLPPAAYPLAIKTLGEFRPGPFRTSAYGLSPVGSRRDLSRLRPLTEPAPPAWKRVGSSVNVNPEPPKPTNYNSVLSVSRTVAPTIAAGEVHQNEPVQGKRWAGIAVVALLAFALFRK